jgi:hypothetical protein
VIKKTVPFIIALLVSCGAFGKAALAQDRRTDSRPAPVAAAEQNNAAQVSDGSEDISITGSVTARELRFEVVPDPKVEFPGKPERNTIWEAERQNLPRPVQPGVTYRNIGIQLKITSVFADIDRIVAEALGEVPVRDNDSPTEPAAPPPPQQQQEAAPPTKPPANQPASEGRQP